MINLKKEDMLGLYMIGFIIYLICSIIFVFFITSNLSEICPKSTSIYLILSPIFFMLIFMIMCTISKIFFNFLILSYDLTLKLNYYVLLFPFIYSYKSYKNKQLDNYIKSFERW